MLLHTIAEHFNNHQDKIQKFIADKTHGLAAPIYLSCDIRNSGKKLAVIDTNLFPAGFNNLCKAYSKITIKTLKYYFERYYPEVKNLILLAEEHTRNRYYLENIHRLCCFLKDIGLQVVIAYPGIDIQDDSIEVSLSNGAPLQLFRIKVEQGLPYAGGIRGDLVLSNNDFSQGIPPILEEILDQIIPHPLLGWHQRRKSRHFQILQELIEELAPMIHLDPWLLQTEFTLVNGVDLNQTEGTNTLAEGVDKTLKKIQTHYEKYQIQDPPYVFVKNDSGTYGMGITEVMQTEEILQMNRRVRNKLLSAKGGRKTDSFLIQEGIPTADFYSEIPIEPVIYLVGFQPVGGFFRMNEEADALSSLNTRGMAFSCLCLHKLDEPHEIDFLNCAEKENLVRLSYVMGQIAAVAAAIEMNNLKK